MPRASRRSKARRAAGRDCTSIWHPLPCRLRGASSAHAISKLQASAPAALHLPQQPGHVQQAAGEPVQWGEQRVLRSGLLGVLPPRGTTDDARVMLIPPWAGHAGVAAGLSVGRKWLSVLLGCEGSLTFAVLLPPRRAPALQARPLWAPVQGQISGVTQVSSSRVPQRLQCNGA